MAKGEFTYYVSNLFWTFDPTFSVNNFTLSTSIGTLSRLIRLTNSRDYITTLSEKVIRARTNLRYEMTCLVYDFALDKSYLWTNSFATQVVRSLLCVIVQYS